MKKLITFILLSFSISVHATDIAQCSNPSGKSYYPELGLVTKNKSGWSDDKISGGLTKLTINENKEFDIVFVDSLKQIISSRDDGGTVLINSFSSESMTFLVIYPGKTIETYTFVRNKSGKYEYIQTTTRSGDEVLITKVSLLRGVCSSIDFELVKSSLEMNKN